MRAELLEILNDRLPFLLPATLQDRLAHIYCHILPFEQRKDLKRPALMIHFFFFKRATSSLFHTLSEGARALRRLTASSTSLL